MFYDRKIVRFLISLIFLLLLTMQLPSSSLAAPQDQPVTGKDWAAAWGMDWGPKYWPTQPVRGGIFQKATPQYIGLMNPNHWPITDWSSIGYFYDKLIHTDGDYKPSVPWLAESWTYQDDVTVIMKLRRGVRFHDGTPFNAEALKYQMEWIMDSANGCWTRSWLEPVKSIEVLDEYTLKWHFKRPWAGFTGVMANAPGYVISAKALKADTALREVKKLERQVQRIRKKLETAEQEAAAASGGAVGKAKTDVEKLKKTLADLEDRYAKTAVLAEGAKSVDVLPVGTGAFIFEEASPGNYLKVKRNPDWWFAKFVGKDMPYYDGIKVSVIPDPSVRLANLRAGKLDYMYVEPAHYTMIKNSRNLQLYVYPLNHVVNAAFNHSKGPCADIRVRKAISHAIDRKALIQGVLFGLGEPASCLLPNDHWAHNPSLKPVGYDPELSKKLLAEAGYKNGLTIKGFVQNTTASQTLAEALKAMLAKVGINWKVELVDPAAIADKLRTLDYDLAEGWWTWIIDPDQPFNGLYHPDGGFNYGRTHNEKANTLIEAGRKEINEAKRIKIYQELEKVLYDNYEDCWLWHPMSVTVYSKNLDGFNLKMYLKGRDAYAYSHHMWFKKGKR